MLDRLNAIIILWFYTGFAALAQPPTRTKILIVDGFSNHDWRQTSKVTKYILEQSGLFDVEISTVPADSIEKTNWNPDFEKYKVVVQNTNNIWTPNVRWSSIAERHLENYVKNGGGLYILHSGNNAFEHWDEYNKMIGLGWRNKTYGVALEIDAQKNIVRIPQNQGENTGHGDRFNALIEKLQNHPINKGYPKKWQTANTEVYHFARGMAQNIEVLSFAYDSTATKRYWPVEWVVKYGEGRVYNSSMGHLWKGEIFPLAYRCVGFQTTMIRAVQWLSGKKVNYPIPANFPAQNKISLQSEKEFLEYSSK